MRIARFCGVTRTALIAASGALVALGVSVTAASAPNLSLVVGSWQFATASPEPELSRSIPRPDDQIDTSNDRPLRMQLAVEADDAEQQEAALNAVAPRVFSRNNYLSIDLDAGTVSVAGSLEQMTFHTNGLSYPTTIDGVALKVETSRTASAIVQRLSGDHALKIDRTFVPSADGTELRVTLTVVSPKVQPAMTVTRTYRRLSAQPFTGVLPPVPDGSVRVSPAGDGRMLVEQDARVSLGPGTRGEVLLVARPVSPVTVALQSLSSPSMAAVDFTMPGPIVEEARSPSAQLPLGTKVELLMPPSPGQQARGPVRILAIHWSTPDGPHACTLPLGLETVTPDEAGTVTINAGVATLADGTTNCVSTPQGFKVRVSYEIADASSRRSTPR